jgi:CBS domain-containing protein
VILRVLSCGVESTDWQYYYWQLFLPTLSAILLDRSPVPVLHPTSTALDAAILMLSKNTSAVMVCNDDGEMVGIFTSKDLMRRVVAVEMDPTECVLSRVMTPNPSSARLHTTILETLHSMHNGKFLHVPVFDEDSKLVGLVDVLQATCAIVQQMGMLQLPKTENVQPLWNELRQSFIPNEESTEGEDAEDEDDVRGHDQDEDESALERSGSSVERRLSWSHSRGIDSADPENDQDPTAVDPTSPEADTPEGGDSRPDVFVFKLADWNGAIHRFTSSAESLKELVKDVQNRLGDYTIRKLHYVDDDGEHVRVCLRSLDQKPVMVF